MRNLAVGATLLCEVVFPLVVFAGGVAYKSPTFTLTALLLFPLFILLGYLYTASLANGKDSGLSPLPLENPPLYPIAHQAGMVMFMLVFGPSSTLLQQVLLIISYFLGHLGVALAGRHAIKKVNWQTFNYPTPSYASLVYLSILLSLGALVVMYVALYAKLLWVALGVFVALCLEMPHLPPTMERGDDN